MANSQRGFYIRNKSHAPTPGDGGSRIAPLLVVARGSILCSVLLKLGVLGPKLLDEAGSAAMASGFAFALSSSTLLPVVGHDCIFELLGLVFPHIPRDVETPRGLDVFAAVDAFDHRWLFVAAAAALGRHS